jgi:hypothetical protein
MKATKLLEVYGWFATEILLIHFVTLLLLFILRL